MTSHVWPFVYTRLLRSNYPSPLPYMDMGVTVHVSSYSHYSFDYRSGPQLKAPCSFAAGENDLKINDHPLILADNNYC